ncbi:MAG: hypothetical protein LAN71_07890 [Acidobacteriia bacterium]|nr:hypothetical protein [Terriglobia bacterium]
MSRFDAIKDAAAALRAPRLWLLHFFGNAALFFLFYEWLRIPEAKLWQLALNIVLGAALVFAALLLHCGTLAWFRDASRSETFPMADSFRRAVRRLPAFLLFLFLAWILWVIVYVLSISGEAWSLFLRSMMPAFLRRHISVALLTHLSAAFFFALRWILVPGLLLPLGVLAADTGFSAFARRQWKTWRSSLACRHYSAVVALAALLIFYAAIPLAGWTPRSEHPTFAGETASLLIRLPLAYSLGLASWLLLCAMAAGRFAAIERAAGNPAA